MHCEKPEDLSQTTTVAESCMEWCHWWSAFIGHYGGWRILSERGESAHREWDDDNDGVREREKAVVHVDRIYM